MNPGSRPNLSVNRQAALCMRCPLRLSVVQGATHLFKEPGTLEAVAKQAAVRFEENLQPASVT